VTDDSGQSRKSVTFERNERSRSAGTAGHVHAESVVTRARNTHVTALNGVGYAVLLDETERGAQCNADAVTMAFRRLGLGEFDHIAKTKAALWLVDFWSKHPNSVEELTLEKARSLFTTINSRFASTTASHN
jgi:hypothetical protein